jgi:hypothetical protein
VLSFFWMSGYRAVGASAVASAAMLCAIGVLTSLFNGRPAWFSALRQLIFSCAAAASNCACTPVLGNHEFKRCMEAGCLERWWQAFPEESGRRWYSVALGSRLQVIALDSDSSLHPASAQGRWLKGQLDDLPAGVRFVLFLLHHPPVTDAADGVRSNEAALAQQLAAAAPGSRARFIVCAAHVHNYERFQRDNMLFLVSGGGGGEPEAVKRSAADLYQSGDFPNFHYLRFQLTAGQLRGEMVRLDADAAGGPSWRVRDHFELDAKTP